MATGAGLTDYAEAKAMDYFLRNTTYAQAATVYMALFTVAPLDDGTSGTETVGDGYGRQAIAFGAYASRRISNSGTVTFTSSGNAWPKAVSFAIFDASSSGNMLAIGTLSPQPTVGAGGSYSFVAGEVFIEFLVFGPTLAQKILDKLFRNTSSATLTTYAALMSAAPDNDGAGGTEISPAGYARQIVTWSAFAAGQSAMAADKQYSASTSTAWGSVVAVALYDSVTTGLFLAKLTPSSVQTFGVGANVTLRASGTALTLD